MSMMKNKKKLTLVIICAVLIIALAVGAFVLLQPDAFKDHDKDGVQIIACVGDSITFGMGAGAKMSELSYPGQLQSLLSDKYQVNNYGISGLTLLKTGDFPYWDNAIFTQSQEALPDVVLIMLGTNDSKPQNWNAEKYAQDLEEFVRVYQALASKPTIYLLKPPAAFAINGASKPAYDISDEVIAEQVVPIVESVAKKTGASIIDLFTLTNDHPEYYFDGVHPNADGYSKIAAAIHKALQ